jgi:NMD protein affecting ribosome stability and mRNA decay
MNDDMYETDTVVPVKTRQGVCPTCGRETTLVYAGEQRWPDRVAERLGVEPVAEIWDCILCQTTLCQTVPRD